jgi:hypothetical protein
MSVIATGLAIGGFICQFVGLRALHWSATIMQLGATLLITAIRSWIRRGLADKYRCYSLPFNLDHISMAVGFRCIAQMKQEPEAFERYLDDGASEWEIPTANDLGTWRGPPWDTLHQGFNKLNDDKIPVEKDPRITIRSIIQQFSTNQNPIIHLAETLHTAFSGTLSVWQNALRSNPRPPIMVSGFNKLSWTLPIHSYDQGLNLRHNSLLRLECGWKPPKDESELHAMLSMWLTTLDGHYIANDSVHLRVLGHWSRYSLATLESLPRWIGSSLAVEPIPVTNEGREFLGRHDIDYGLRGKPKQPLFGLSLNSHRK